MLHGPSAHPTIPVLQYLNGHKWMFSAVQPGLVFLNSHDFQSSLHETSYLWFQMHRQVTTASCCPVSHNASENSSINVCWTPHVFVKSSFVSMDPPAECAVSMSAEVQMQICGFENLPLPTAATEHADSNVSMRLHTIHAWQTQTHTSGQLL